MKYSNEEKLSIVARCQQGESVAALSNELAIPRSTLYRWLKSFPTDSAGKLLKFSYQEYTLLQRKVAKRHHDSEVRRLLGICAIKGTAVRAGTVLWEV